VVRLHGLGRLSVSRAIRARPGGSASSATGPGPDGPGSAAHHSALQSSLRRLRTLVCVALRAAPHPGHDELAVDQGRPQRKAPRNAPKQAPKIFSGAAEPAAGVSVGRAGTGSIGPSELVVPRLHPASAGFFLWVSLGFRSACVTLGNDRRERSRAWACVHSTQTCAFFNLRGRLPGIVPYLNTQQCRVPPSPPAIRGMKKPRRRKLVGASDLSGTKCPSARERGTECVPGCRPAGRLTRR
jgi:hypothetical protein